ncbi:MAG: electron transport complex subunit RsxC, partial [bacterium]|nr:electron transport complex subunit RsxC [bacterium]
TVAESMAIVIETENNSDIPEESPVMEDPDWRHLSAEAMIAKIAAAGIVGLGGAAFPTYRKLRLPPGVAVDTLILNGAECEPYLTCDERLMMEEASEIIEGGFLLAKIVGAQKVLIGVEDNKPLAFNVLKEAVSHLKLPMPVHIVACKARYPQGSEKQLIEALTQRKVPPGKLPFHVGVVVQNVATAFSCYHAIRYGSPLLDRVITVSGGGILNPKNLRVPIGTSVEAIAQFCGGIHHDTVKVIAGGPMMGRASGRLDVPVTKGMSGILFFRSNEIRADHYGPCISCGRCLEACPLGLEPNQISIYTEAGRALETEEFGTKECFECGCCSFVCPAERPLVQFIQMAKQAFQTGSQIGLGVYPGGIHVC